MERPIDRWLFADALPRSSVNIRLIAISLAFSIVINAFIFTILFYLMPHWPQMLEAELKKGFPSTEIETNVGPIIRELRERSYGVLFIAPAQALPAGLKEWFQACAGAGSAIGAFFLFSFLGRLFDQRRARRNGVKLAPGSMLLRWSFIIFSSKTFERVIQPVIADMQFEYFEALRAAEQALRANDAEESKRQLRRARFAYVRGYFVFLVAAAGVVLTFIGSIVKMWKSAH